LARRKVWQARFEKRRALKQKRPVDAFPSGLIFWLRANEMLHGLGAALDAHVPYLGIVGPYARAALQCHRANTVRASLLRPPPDLSRTVDLTCDHASQPPPPLGVSDVTALTVADVERVREVALFVDRPVAPPTPSWLPAAFSTGLERSVYGLLLQLWRNGDIVGAQVAAVDASGRLVCDASLGTLGRDDPRPVTGATLFPCFSVTKGVVATVFHAVVEGLGRGDDVYDQPVTQLWPAYATSGTAKAATTVRHVLSHAAGMQHAVPAEIMNMATFPDCARMVAAMEAEVPATPPGRMVAYHYYTWGWLVAGLLAGMVPETLPALLRKHVTDPLHIPSEEMWLGEVAHELIGTPSAPSPTVAVLSGGVPTPLNPHTTSGSGAGAGAPATAPAPDLTARLLQMVEEGLPEGPPLPPLDADSSQWTAAVCRRADMGALASLVSRMRDRVHLLDPRLFNATPMKRGVIPAANGHFSARALARMYAGLGSGRLLPLPRMRQATRLCGTAGQMSMFMQGGPGTRFGLGYQLLGSQAADFTPASGLPAFGHSGFGGSLAWWDPCDGGAKRDGVGGIGGLGIAITVNHLATGAGTRGPTAAILQLLGAEVGAVAAGPPPARHAVAGAGAPPPAVF